MRPIDADALRGCAIIRPHNNAEIAMIRKFRDLVNHFEIPTVDAVPVVRCKDCLFSEKRRYLGDTVLYCTQFDDFMEESDFCCRAERKDCET